MEDLKERTSLSSGPPLLVLQRRWCGRCSCFMPIQRFVLGSSSEVSVLRHLRGADLSLLIRFLLVTVGNVRSQDSMSDLYY